MPRNRLRIDVDLGDFQDMLDAFEGPGPQAQLALTDTFAETFAYLDSRVPVDTGALRASAQVSMTDEPSGGEWSAAVTWGAPETGVVYAQQALYYANTFDGVEQFYDEFADALGADVEGWRS